LAVVSSKPARSAQVVRLVRGDEVALLRQLTPQHMCEVIATGP
jgi:hypothetical protein